MRRVEGGGSSGIGGSSWACMPVCGGLTPSWVSDVVLHSSSSGG